MNSQDIEARELSKTDAGLVAYGWAMKLPEDVGEVLLAGHVRELTERIAFFAAAEYRRGVEDAARAVCPECKDGLPLAFEARTWIHVWPEQAWTVCKAEKARALLDPPADAVN